MMREMQMEEFHDEGRLLAMIVRAEYAPAHTCFITPDELAQQVGFVVHPAGHEIARHLHPAQPVQTARGMEVVLVRRGRLEVELYTPTRTLLATRILAAGDLLLVMGVGHHFRMLEDTVLLEIKQGPKADGQKEFF